MIHDSIAMHVTQWHRLYTDAYLAPYHVTNWCLDCGNNDLVKFVSWSQILPSNCAHKHRSILLDCSSHFVYYKALTISFRISCVLLPTPWPSSLHSADMASWTFNRKVMALVGASVVNLHLQPLIAAFCPLRILQMCWSLRNMAAVLD